MSTWVNCVNCGKQNIVLEDEPWDVKCEFGDHRLRIKEGTMAAKINADDLHPETVARLGIGEEIKHSNLPPVPPRPPGIPSHDYYERHKEEILSDLKYFGEENKKVPVKTMKRWGISHATWLIRRNDGSVSGLALRWGLIPGYIQPQKVVLKRSVKKRRGGQTGNLNAAMKGKTPSVINPAESPAPRPQCATCPFKLDALEYAGYRKAVETLAGGLRK